MSSIPIGLYLFKRLHSMGIRSILGVPGDYNLALLGLHNLVPLTDNIRLYLRSRRIELDWQL